MSASAATARILITTDSATDGNDVQRSLEAHFDNLRVSANPELAVQDFEQFQPDVVVLAFDCIEKAQRHYQELHGTSPGLHLSPHRTILLCAKGELSAAFELCKMQHFDDYVLYWPHAYEGLRLPMSVWNASRECLAARTHSPPRSEMLSHAQHLRDLDAVLNREFGAATEQAASADSALAELGRELSRVSNEFSQRLLRHGIGGAVKINDPNALSLEIERMTSQQTEKTKERWQNTVMPMTAWADNLRESVEPALAGTRALAEGMRHARRVLMVVDDDEVIQEVLAHAVDSESYEILFVSDSADALAQLRRMRPDAILMDINLPGIDGVSFTRCLKASPHLSSIPIIMLTGDARQETLRDSIGAGATDFIVKPFTRESLNAKLQRVLAAPTDPSNGPPRSMGTPSR